ncbi:hypothetical protein GCM10027614_70330 [Micromonospora vulcania]
MSDLPLIQADRAVPPPPATTSTGGRRRRLRLLSRTDRVVITLMVLVPLLLVTGFVWLPAVATVLLSGTDWDGIGPLNEIDFVGARNYSDVVNIYPPFVPAVQHNLLWLAVLFVVATPFGMFLAVLLDKEIRGSRFYQTALYLPVVLSLALIGFVWQLLYSRDQGLINAVFGSNVDWYGGSSVNIWAVMIASGWRHVGYIMLLYLAGLKGVDPSLREAAAVDGASESRTFFRVVFPVLRPINIIVLVVTVIESLRAFDLVWVVNKGRNGLELISALVTQNVVGEASRIGFGSALATIMLVVSLVFIAIYLATVIRRTGNEHRDPDPAYQGRPGRAGQPPQTDPGADAAARLPHRRRTGLALPDPLGGADLAALLRVHGHQRLRLVRRLDVQQLRHRLADGGVRQALPQLGVHHRAGGAVDALPRVLRGVRHRAIQLEAQHRAARGVHGGQSASPAGAAHPTVPAVHRGAAAGVHE